MKTTRFGLAALLAAMALTSNMTPLEAQHRDDRGPASHHSERGPISHHSERSKDHDDEYLMSHLDADAGDLIALVLPHRFHDMPIKSGRWEVVEREKVKVVDYSSMSANVRLLSSGTTVVEYRYRYMREGKEETGTYPFTIRIHRIEPETLNLSSTLYVGWDLSLNLPAQVVLRPQYSESPLTFSIDDPSVAEIRESYSGTQLVGKRPGETRLYVSTPAGLEAEARVVVEIPELHSLDIKAPEKKMAIGDEMQLSLKLTPERAQPEIQWTSDNPTVVSVTPEGKVTALAEGKATIRVTSDNNVKDSVTIRVKK